MSTKQRKTVTKKAAKAPAPAKRSIKKKEPELTPDELIKTLKKDKQIVDQTTFDPSRIIFSDAIKNTKTDARTGNSTTVGYRSNISYRYDDETYGPLLLFFDQEAQSYGVTLNHNDKDELTGHSISFVIHDNANPTQVEKQFLRTIQAIYEAACTHIVEHQLELCFRTNDASIGNQFSLPLNPKDPSTKEVDYTKRNLKIYPKLFEFPNKKKDGKEVESGEPFRVVTQFYSYDDPDETIKYSDLIDVWGYARPLIGVESIWCGSNRAASMQLKVHEVSDWRASEQSMSRLTVTSRPTAELTKPVAPSKLTKLPVSSSSSSKAASAPSKPSKANPPMKLEEEEESESEEEYESESGEEYESE
jgi:hypothetical protein